MVQSSYDELESKLSVTENGQVVVLVGNLITCYFIGSQRVDVQEAVIACFEYYQEKCRNNLHWVKHPKTFKFYPVESSAVPASRSWLQLIDKGESWEFELRGGPDPDSANSFSVKVFGASEVSDRKGNLSYFRATLPLTWFADNPGTLPSMALDFCNLLKPLSGYGGPGILESPNPSYRQEFAPIVYKMAQQFPGLEVDYPVVHTLYLKNGIKGVNWLTILGDDWLSKVGGIPALKGRLGEQFLFHQYPYGIIVQAGPKPQIGDTQQHIVPDLYIQLARILKPIQINKHRAFQNAGPGDRFNRENSEKWLFRFD